jgi:hypothetical protein
VRGVPAISSNPSELLCFATEIGARYMGKDPAGEFGRRNAVPGELVMRLTPQRIIARSDVAGY